MVQPVTEKSRQLKNPLIIAGIVLALLAAVSAGVVHWYRSDYAYPGDPVVTPDPDRTPPAAPDNPSWPEPPVINRPLHVRGIYYYVRGVESHARLSELVELIRNSELNAMVIDVKDDIGRLTYPGTLVPWAEQAGACDILIEDPAAFIADLAEHGIYPIARIVAFKDDVMAQHRPDLAIQSRRGGLWRDDNGYYWLDPYNKESWKYIVALAREAAQLGFREIQFDYVRFPYGRNVPDAVYPAWDSNSFSADEVIPAFLRYARASLAEYDVELSADIFGSVTSVLSGQAIRQQLELMAPEVDILCPMVYPDHYEPGAFGIADPKAAPYDILYHALNHGQRRLEGAGLDTGLRPWLQAYGYSAADIRAQIKAAEDLGIYEFLLWNMNNYYIAAALRAPDKE